MGKEAPTSGVLHASGGSQVVQLAFTQNKILVLPTPPDQGGRAERLPGATPSSYCYCVTAASFQLHAQRRCHSAFDLCSV